MSSGTASSSLGNFDEIDALACVHEYHHAAQYEHVALSWIRRKSPYNRTDVA